MKKVSVIRFRPKSGHRDEFIGALSDFMNSKSHPGQHEQLVAVKDDEVISIVIRDADYLEESARDGVAWLDSVRHMLDEYNATDRHTIPLTADLVKEL